VAQHGFESVTLDLAKDYPHYKAVLGRHNIPITRRLIIEELAEIENSATDSEIIRRILEARTPHCGPRKRGNPLCQLNRSLAELELALEKMEESAAPSL